MLAGPIDRSGSPATVAVSPDQTDLDTLLEGEDPGSTRIDDAVHWVTVYGELLTVKASLIDRTDAFAPLPGAGDVTRDTEIDQRMLRAEADRCRRRLDYWTQRAKQLAEPGRFTAARGALG